MRRRWGDVVVDFHILNESSSVEFVPIVLPDVLPLFPYFSAYFFLQMAPDLLKFTVDFRLNFLLLLPELLHLRFTLFCVYLFPRPFLLLLLTTLLYCCLQLLYFLFVEGTHIGYPMKFGKQLIEGLLMVQVLSEILLVHIQNLLSNFLLYSINVHFLRPSQTTIFHCFWPFFRRVQNVFIPVFPDASKHVQLFEVVLSVRL